MIATLTAPRTMNLTSNHVVSKSSRQPRSLPDSSRWLVAEDEEMELAIEKMFLGVLHHTCLLVLLRCQLCLCTPLSVASATQLTDTMRYGWWGNFLKIRHLHWPDDDITPRLRMHMSLLTRQLCCCSWWLWGTICTWDKWMLKQRFSTDFWHMKFGPGSLLSRSIHPSGDAFPNLHKPALVWSRSHLIVMPCNMHSWCP